MPLNWAVVADALDLVRELGDLALDRRAVRRCDSAPFLYWTASSRTRCSIAWTSLRLPSAVWTSEMPSWMLRCAWPRPRACARMRSEIPRPAASSPPRLIRKPEDRRSMDLAMRPVESTKAAVRAERLDVVLDAKGHQSSLLDDGGGWIPGQLPVAPACQVFGAGPAAFSRVDVRPSRRTRTGGPKAARSL